MGEAGSELETSTCEEIVSDIHTVSNAVKRRPGWLYFDPPRIRLNPNNTSPPLVQLIPRNKVLYPEVYFSDGVVVIKSEMIQVNTIRR